MVAVRQSERVGVRAIEVAVPPTVIRQERLRELLATRPGISRLGERLVRAAFDASAIETRHTVLEEFGDETGPRDPALFDVAGGTIGTPGTRARNDAYIAHAAPLTVEAGRRALAASGLEARDVTHVITVSCTGFSAPGPDFALVQQLGLRPSTQRLHIGFMGCYGAFPALRTAEQFCRADPEAVVLVVCVELCSLHLHLADDADTIVASSVFADGAAAAVVSARPAPAGARVLELEAFETMLVPEGEGDMAWTIGDEGFDMVLSTYVPRIVEQNIEAALEPLLSQVPQLESRPWSAIENWAIHPGGRSILDRVQSTLGLSDAQLTPSRDVLRDYGNMSSATVLFILQRLLRGDGPVQDPRRELVGAASGFDGPGSPARSDRPATSERAADSDSLTEPERVCAMAFGPGLTVETAVMTLRTV